MGVSAMILNVRRSLAVLGGFLALTATVVALSGCGASATLDPIAKAAEVSSRQAGARISMAMHFSSPALPSGFGITAEGFIDERHGSGEMSMNISHLPGASSLSSAGSTVQMIFQTPVIYMNMAALSSQLPQGKKWMKLDVGKLAEKAGIDPSQLSSMNQTDPTQLLDYLKSSSGGVLILGHEQLDGVGTTHYQATLQLSHVLGSLSEDRQAAAKAMLSGLGSNGEIPIDVWVDAQQRIRQVQMSIGTSPSGGAIPGALVSGTITLDLSHYGPVPPIVAPPANEVFDMNSLPGA